MQKVSVIKYTPNVVLNNIKASSLYTSFGSSIDEMSYSSDTTNKYRYGFNGMELDNETSVEGGHYDFGARIYDSRTGRWLACDKKQGKYPGYSPYNYCANNPLLFVDPDGNELHVSMYGAGDVQNWNIFKSIIESRFNSLITISYTEHERKIYLSGEYEKNDDGTFKYENRNGKLYRIPAFVVEKYYKVNMAIDDVALRNKAIASLPENSSPDAIQTAVDKLKKELISGNTYSELNSMISSPIISRYNFTSQSFGAFAGQNGGSQGISPGIINQYMGIEGLGAFTLLLHELSEGFTFATNKAYNGNPNNTDKKSLTYVTCHLAAIKAQCQDLGLVNMTVTEDPEVFGGQLMNVGGELNINTYKTGANGMIEKTTYSIHIDKDGNVANHPVDGKPYTATTTQITKQQYNTEVKTYEDAAKKSSE